MTKKLEETEMGRRRAKKMTKKVLKRFGISYGTFLIVLSGISYVLARLSDGMIDFKELFFEWAPWLIGAGIVIESVMGIAGKFKRDDSGEEK